MIYFFLILKTKLDQNAHQNTPNLPFKKKFSGGGAMPPNPPSKAHGFACKFPNQKKKSCPPPLPNPG